MVIRVALLTIAIGASAPAQFFGLSSNPDGSALYFTSTLRLKGTDQPLNSKIFSASNGEISLFRAQLRTPRPSSATEPCTVGGFDDYLGTESAGGGTMAVFYLAQQTGLCSYPHYRRATQLSTPAGELTLPDSLARLSANGRFAVVYTPATGRLYDGLGVAVLDFESGERTPIRVPSQGYLVAAWLPLTGGRRIADDGTALISFSNGGFVVRPGGEPEPFPVEKGIPLAISADGVRVLFSKNGFHLYDFATDTSTLLVSADQPTEYEGLSDDAGRLLYLAGGQAWLLDTATLEARSLTSDPDGISAAAISGDGSTVYAATRTGGLVVVSTANRATTRIIGRTPYLDSVYAHPSLTAGLAPTFTGSGLSDITLNGTVPLDPYLGNVTMWLGEQKIPVVSLAPSSVRVLIPWDAPSGTNRILAEVPGEQTPFGYPETEVTIAPAEVRAGAIARQDWTQTYSGPVRRGEVIHTFAIGLGPVAPEVPAGYPAPAAEPLARTARPLTCTNGDVLYAGLAPGTVERVYQVDLRVTAPAGYQKFYCALGDATPFLFLSLNVEE